MRYTHDNKLASAKKYINSLDDSEESELIKYYIQKKNDHISYLDTIIEEYREFFKILNKFLPKSNILR